MIQPIRPGQGPPQLAALSVLRFDGDGDVREISIARVAAWNGRAWDMRSGWRARVSGERDVTLETYGHVIETRLERPGYFSSARQDPESLSFAAFRRYVEEQEAAGYPVESLRVDLHGKLAFPAATFVLLIVGLPFAFTTGGRGALYGVGIAVILAVLYYVALATFSALGSAAYLPPIVAAWAPNVLFALGGFYLLLHVRT